MRINMLKFSIFIMISLMVASSTYTVTKRRIDRPIPYTIQYFLTDSDGKQVSCWSDIDINIQSDTLTAIIQIPKQNTAKMQMVKQYLHHPIAQDIRTSKYNKKIELRHYAIPLPLVNYGFIPMTWQQSIAPDATGFYGDDDPIDVVDLSSRDRQILDIVKVKVLGAFCLIDEGELDWKVLVIDVDEAKQMNINSYEDLPAGRVQEIISWFKLYKTYQGKPQNVIGFGEKVFSKQQTLQIIFDTHVQFMKLKRGLGIEYAARKLEYNL